MRTQTFFFVSTLVGADLVIDTPIHADEPVRAPEKAKSKSRSKAKAAPVAKIKPTVTPPPVEAPPPEKKEELCKINVKVENLRKSDGNYVGQICYTLFKGKDGFPDKSDLAVLNECVKVEQAATLSFTIDGRQCNQDYAIAILHDENFNRQLDKNIAIPKEGVGMSNNPSFIRVNAPPYDDVKFMLQPPSAQQAIRIHYFN